MGSLLDFAHESAARPGNWRMAKKPASKAAASESPKAYSFGYVEGLSEARTQLEGFYAILR